jgi:HEAT repeat protein
LTRTAAHHCLCCAIAGAKTKVSRLAKKLLYGDETTRTEAVQAFNKMPSDEQYKLVPDFMVALTDEDPMVRKIASRILKVMGVKTEDQVPDAKKELSSAAAKPSAKEKWAEEKKLRETETTPSLRKEPVPPMSKELMTPPPKPSGDSQWSDLQNMRGGESGNYTDLKREIDLEKKGQVTLDPGELRAESDSYATPLSSVIQSLKDPDPWVRAQAARRLGMVHPAPVETIPTLIDMLGDKEVESRRAAAAALGSFGPLAREAIPALTKALADPDNGVSLLAGDALKQIQQPR